MQSRKPSSGGSFSRARIAPLLLLAVLAAPLGACSSFSSLFTKDDSASVDEPPDKLYNEGVFLLNNRHDYKEAAKKFEEVERQYPYSEWARKALISRRMR